MSRLVDDLLDMSRITRGKIELRKERVELAAVVDYAVETVRALLLQHGSGIVRDVCPRFRLTSQADPTRLAQVIGNLLNNACKFTEQGGHVSLTAQKDTTRSWSSVSDNGIGFAPDQLPGIFDMFAQVDPRSIAHTAASVSA